MKTEFKEFKITAKAAYKKIYFEMSTFIQFKTSFSSLLIENKSDFTLLALISIKRFRLFYSLPKEAF